MTRAKQISPDEDPVDPQIWLAQILQSRFEKIVKLYSAPLEHPGDEGVHDMRVSIRRVRSALRGFAQLTDKPPPKKLRKNLKSLADLLGAVRDLDVAIEAFTNVSREADSDSVKEGIAEIVEDCKNKRHDAYDRLTKHLDSEGLDDLTKDFDRALDRSLRQRELFAATSVTEAARLMIENRLDRFLAEVDAIYDPFAVRRIHRLRIAGKHLRYSIELFEDLWDGELLQFADETKKMQTYLGDLHDRDFWIAGSGKRISAKRPSNEREETIDQARIWLLSEFTRQRMEAYRSALRTWSEWRATDFAGRLRNVMNGGI